MPKCSSCAVRGPGVAAARDARPGGTDDRGDRAEGGDKNAPVSLDDPGLLAGIVGIGFGVPEVIVVLLGGLAFTQEFRYGTATSTYLGEPRRTRVLVAK
jgi:hypothetical protein